MKYNYKKLVETYQAWVARETGGNPDHVPGDVAEVTRLLGTGTSEADCRVLGGNLSYLANWYARRGVCLVAQGEPKGWSDLSASALNDFWNIRIRCRSYDRLENKFRVGFLASILQAGKCGILCMALNAGDEGSWMAQRLQQSRSDGSIGAWEWKDLAVPRLVIALHRYAAGQTDVSGLELGVYKSVFGAWNDSAELQKVLLKVADYHVENLRDKGSERWGEFARPPVDIFPAELVAIQRVREKLGLETPSIEHPLMKTPFANPPKDLRPQPDELLTQVLDKVRTIMPGL